MAYTLANEYYKDLMSDLLATEEFNYILQAGFSVVVLASDKEKKAGSSKKVLGDCGIVPEKWKPFCPYDFAITIYEPNCCGLSEQQMRTVMRHEMLHVGINEKGKPFVRPHDIEDFWEIIESEGLHWAET